MLVDNLTYEQHHGFRGWQKHKNKKQNSTIRLYIYSIVYTIKIIPFLLFLQKIKKTGPLKNKSD